MPTNAPAELFGIQDTAMSNRDLCNQTPAIAEENNYCRTYSKMKTNKPFHFGI